MAQLLLRLTPSPARLIQVGLALYLLPALSVVLAVGAVGVLVLAARELCCDIFKVQGRPSLDQISQDIFFRP